MGLRGSEGRLDDVSRRQSRDSHTARSLSFDFSGSLLIRCSIALFLLVAVALVAYWIVAPDGAQEKYAQAASNVNVSDEALIAGNVSVDKDPDAGLATTADIPVPGGQSADSGQLQANGSAGTDNSIRENLINSIRNGQIPDLFSSVSHASTRASGNSSIYPSTGPGFVYHGDRQTTGNTTGNGTSRYIVVFDNASPGTLQMAKEQVKDFAESQAGEVVHEYSIINGMTVAVPDNVAGELASIDGVKYVEADQTAYATLDRAVNQTAVDQVWGLGYDGTGVTVCLIDTGVDAGHPDLTGKVTKWIDYVNNKASAYDDNGHGTHCAGTIVGSGSASGGKYTGVAPGASLMVAKVLSSAGSGSYSDIIAAINWAVTNHAQVISMSLGGSHSKALTDAVDSAVSHNVTVVVAAGNDGQYGPGTIDCPGDDPNAITVGAVDRNDTIAYFSSRGPTSAGCIKPDVTNMGVGLVAARASGTSMGTPVNAYYTAMSGTSMATPMTAGVVALLLEKNASLTPAQVKAALTQTAVPLGSGIPDNVYGYGRVDAKAAFEYVLNGNTTRTSTPTPTPAPAASGTPVELWNQTYSQNAAVFGSACVRTADGGYAGTGYVYSHANIDAYLVKTDAKGNKIWSQTYGGYTSEAGYSLQQTADGGYVIAGISDSRDNENSSIYLLRTDAAGTMLWNRSYTFGTSDSGTAILVAADGGYVVAGKSTYGSDSKISLFKTYANGTLMWNRTLVAADSVTSLQPAADGGYIIGGTYTNQSPYNYYGSSAILVKTDAAGNLAWNRTFKIGPTVSTTGYAAEQTADGGYILTGSAFDSYSEDLFLIKTDRLGNILWNRTFNGTEGAYGIDVQQTPDGGFIISGSNYSTSDVYQKIYLLKTDGSGNFEWDNAFWLDNAFLSSGNSVFHTADDGYAVYGMCFSLSSSIAVDVVLIKTDSSGRQQWFNTYSEPCLETCSWVQQTDDGGYVMTGTSDSLNYGYDASLIRLDRYGNIVSKKSIGGTDDETGNMVLQNSNGDYVVAGQTYSTGTRYSQALLAQVGSDGYIDWTKSYGNSSDCWAKAVLQTTDGGYVMAGGKDDPQLGDCDAFVVRTDSRGVELWNKTYGGNGDDWINSIVPATDGGYLLTGGTYSDGSGNCDIYVKKITSTGASQWGYYYYTDSDIWGNSAIPTSDGGYVITGGVRYNGAMTKVALFKISSSGSIVWSKYYGSASYQEGKSINITADGGFLIGGTYYDDANKSYRAMVMKTDSSGAIVWGPVISGSGNTYGYNAVQTSDYGYAVAGTSYVNDTAEGYLVRLSSVVASSSHMPIQQANMPPMVSGHQTAGGVSGRITTQDTTIGVASADVYLVNASNTSQYYWHGTTNAQGYFQITNVSNTWDGLTYQSRYRIYAYESQYGETYSSNFTVEDGLTACASAMMITSSSGLLPTPPYPDRIVAVVPAPAMQGSQDAGAVYGRVTSFNTTIGLAGAFVAIVNASNTSQAFYVAQTDSKGYYLFTNVNHTFDPSSGTYSASYKIYANSSLYGEGCSNNFSVEPRPYALALTAVIICPVPANLSVSASHYSIMANSTDYTNISVYVTDANGDRVVDGSPITFRINQSGWSASKNGSLVDYPGNHVQQVTVQTINGYANASFGWVDGASTGKYSVINFSFDYRANVKASLAIAFLGAKPALSHRPIQVVSAPAMGTYQTPGSVTGRVTSYNSLDGIANAYVAIVNASNITQAFYVGQTNSQGYFQFLNVNNTFDGVGYGNMLYKVYADGGTGGEGYSGNFSEEIGAARSMNVVLRSYDNTSWVKSAWGICKDIQPTEDGGYILAGYTGTSNNDISLVKTDGYGNVLWNRTYGGSQTDVANAVLQTADGGYILGGFSYSYDFLQSACVIKTDAVGNVLWSHTYGSTNDDIRFILQTADGGYVMTGGHYYENPANNYYPVMYLMKIDASGNVLWQKNMTTQSSTGDNIIATSDGGFVVAGSIVLTSTNADDYLVKTDRNGNVLWSQTYNLPMWDYVGSARQTSDGGFVIWSSAGSTSADSVMNLIKTDSGGVKQWNRTYNITGDDEACSIVQTGDGGYMAVYTTNPPYGTVKMMKLDSAGTITGNMTLDSLWSYALCSAQAPDGGFVVAGYRWAGGTVSAFVARMFDIRVNMPVPAAPYPGYVNSVIAAPSMQGSQMPGSVTGRVTTGTWTGLANTFVAILNASNTRQAYYVGQTDAQGYFRFLDVNHTFDMASGKYIANYLIYANNSTLGSGISANFTVEAGSTATTQVIITPVAAHIYMTPGSTGVVADGAGSINITAYVTDALNNPVVAGTPILFTINKGQSYSASMGSWSGCFVNTTIVGANDSGYASATFGSVPADMVGNSSTITVEYNMNTTVRNTTRVSFDPIKVSWSGSVTKQWGNPAPGVNVVLHLCGPAGEVYTLNNTTDSYPDWGCYSFDDIALLPNVTYGYASVNWTDVNGVNYSGHSEMYLLKKTHTSAAAFEINPSLPLLHLGCVYATVSEGSDVTEYIYRFGDSSMPVSVDVELVGGTAISGVDYTASPAAPGTISFVAGETARSFTIHANPGSAGKYLLFRLANASGAIADLTLYALSFNSSWVPVQQVSCPAMSAGVNHTGGISGRITVLGTTTGIAGADIYLLNASNTSQYYWHGTSNDQGYYQATGINNTWSDTANVYQASYKIYGYDSTWGEGYSNNFSVEPDSTAGTVVMINPKPAHIDLAVSKGRIDANGADYATVSARVTDALGNPVSDGQPVLLMINPGYLYNATVDGRWGSGSTPYVVVNTIGGYANATYGWVSGVGSNNFVALEAESLTDTTLESFNIIKYNYTALTASTRWIINLGSGWNLISLPVTNSTLYASDLIGNVSLGVDMVSVYNNSTGGYTTYYTGAAAWKNVQLSPDRGYFVHGTKTSSFDVYGTVVQSHTIDIYRGWNLIGWTCTNVDAGDVLGRGTISMVSRYNKTTKSYQTYYVGASPVKMFTFTAGEGYFLRSDVSNVQQILMG